MNDLIGAVYWTSGLVIIAVLLWFAASSHREKQPRAVKVSLLLLVGAAAFWIAYSYLSFVHPSLLLIPPGGLFVLTLLFFFPGNKPSTMSVGEITERVDERDVMFAREEYLPGTEKYEAYYAMRPHLKEVDDMIRELPPLLSPGGKYYDADVSARVTSVFRTIAAMTTQVDGEAAPTREAVDPIEITARMKRQVLEMGASEVGIARLNPMYVYTNVGRGPEPWGAPIVNNHRFAIVFTLEMDYDRVHQAPRLPTVEESADRYLDAARLSIELARQIRGVGYPARAHISDSNYQIMLPPVAVDAGLGELGRLGYLISPRYGARVRLGAVTTDLELIPDHPITFGVQDFCEKCRKCADNCPSAAIPANARTEVRGVDKWPTNVEQCVRYWRTVGTDCGLCMKVCPYSHPPTLLHNLVRAGIRRSSIARSLAVWADDLFYGRKLPIDRL